MTALFSAMNPSLAASESPNPRRIDASCGNKKAPAHFRLRTCFFSCDTLTQRGDPPPPSTVVAVAIRKGQKDACPRVRVLPRLSFAVLRTKPNSDRWNCFGIHGINLK